MVTASWRTALKAFVMKEISPRKMFVPRFKRIIMPIEAMKTNGVSQLSRKISMARMERMTAMAT